MDLSFGLSAANQWLLLFGFSLLGTAIISTIILLWYDRWNYKQNWTEQAKKYKL